MQLLEEGRRSPTIAPAAPSSRSPHTTYLDRIDPIHELDFHDVVSSRWAEVSVIEHRLAMSPSGSLMHDKRAIPAPVTHGPVRLYHPLAIRTMAVLTQFHQVSTLQITTLTGGAPKAVAQTLRILYSAGLVQRCSNKWTHAPRDDRFRGGIGDVWQLRYDPTRLEEWLSGLTDLEHSLLSGGRDLLKGTAGVSGATSIRHNLSMAEIVIRATEACPGVVGGWGEPLTTADLFADMEPGMREGIADGAIVGRDGSIILIETSGASNIDRPHIAERTAEKALAWAAVCARSELPLKVLFVNISPKVRMPRFHWHVSRGLDRIGEKVVRKASQQKGRESVFVANALDWFPFPLAVSEGFRELEAHSTETGRWHPILPVDTPLDPRADVVANTLAALHLPPWIAN